MSARLQLVKFLLVGGTTAFVEYTVFVVLKLGLKLDILPAHVISFFLAAVYNFWLNRTWVFEAPGLGYPLLKYLTLLTINLGLGSLLITQLSQFIPAVVGKLLTIMIIACWNFIIYKHLVFTNDKTTQQ